MSIRKEDEMKRLAAMQEARDAGKKTYFTGVPCKHGHVAERRLDNSTCCECIRIKLRARPYKEMSDEHKEKQRGRARAAHLARYGIDAEIYDTMLVEQQHVCPICERTFGGEVIACVDHHHGTGKVRNILCKHCNTAVGMIRDDIATAVRLVEYLQRHA